MTDHPRDEWVDITGFGSPVPQRILAVDGRLLDLRDAQNDYIAGRITVEELEERLANLDLAGT